MSRALPVPTLPLLAALLASALLLLTSGAAAGRTEPAGAGRGAGANAAGYDISYPQCGGRYPANFAFGVVGVTNGRAFSANPCLGAGGTGASQLAWAGAGAQLYMNTGNPGPVLSTHWPVGQSTPRTCTTDDPDSANCAYDYGWNAAADAYGTAVDAYVSIGLAEKGATHTPTSNAWWLDVETANSWRTDTSLNVAALQGTVDYLESVDAAAVGFYSVGPMWQAVTGGTAVFADRPTWLAGARTLRGARANCSARPFTGGSLEMTQYLVNGVDADYRC